MLRALFVLSLLFALRCSLASHAIPVPAVIVSPLSTMKVAIMATGVTEAAADAALTTAFSLGSSDVDVVLSTEDESIAAANGMLMSMMLVGQTLVAAVADVVMYELDAYWYHDSSASINKAVANQLKLGIDTPTTLKNWN